MHRKTFVFSSSLSVCLSSNLWVWVCSFSSCFIRFSSAAKSTHSKRKHCAYRSLRVTWLERETHTKKTKTQRTNEPMLNTKCRGWLFFSFCSCFSLLYEVLNWYSCLRPHKINHLNYRIVDRFTPHTNSIKNESYRWCQSFESIRLSLLFKLENCDGKQSHCLLCAISLISSYEKAHSSILSNAIVLVSLFQCSITAKQIYIALFIYIQSLANHLKVFSASIEIAVSFECTFRWCTFWIYVMY